MSATVSGSFKTRREAEMLIERLVQEYHVERTDIFVSAAGDNNTVGIEDAGSDRPSGEPSVEARDDAPLNGAINVSVDLEDDDLVTSVQAAFAEFSADQVNED